MFALALDSAVENVEPCLDFAVFGRAAGLALVVLALVAFVDADEGCVFLGGVTGHYGQEIAAGAGVHSSGQAADSPGDTGAQ